MERFLIRVLDRLAPATMRRVRAEVRHETLLEVRRIWLLEAVRGLKECEAARDRSDCPGSCDRTK